MKFKISVNTPYNEYTFATGAYKSEKEAFRLISLLEEKLEYLQKRLRTLEESAQPPQQVAPMSKE